MNSKVKIFRYVMENTFDAYQWQLIENKQKFIGQIMTSKSPVRSCEDVDEAALTYAEVKALATGNPHIKEKMELDMEVAKLRIARANHDSQKYRLEDHIIRDYPMQISALKERITGYEKDIAVYKANIPEDKDGFVMEINGKEFTDKKEAGEAIITLRRNSGIGNPDKIIGRYAGMELSITFERFYEKFMLSIHGNLTYKVEVGKNPVGNIARINNALEGMEKSLTECREKLANVEVQLEEAKKEVVKPFEKEAELSAKQKRLSELNAELNMDLKEDNAADLDDEPEKAAAPEERPSVRKKQEEGRNRAIKPSEAIEEVRKMDKAL